MAFFLGLDPSLSHIGVARIETNPTGKVVAYVVDTIGVPGRGRRTKQEYEGWRLNYLWGKYIDCFDDRPDFVGVEGYAFSACGNITGLAEAEGVLKLVLYHNSLPFLVVPPTTLKKFWTGKGNATKDLMMQTTLDNLNFWPRDDNQNDAFALANLLLYKETGACMIPVDKQREDAVKCLRALSG